MNHRRRVAWMIVAPLFAWVAWLAGAEEKTHKLSTVSLRKMADSLRAVIAADQRAYVDAVTHRKDASAGVLPDHAEMLRRAAQSIQRHGAEFSYTLRSLHPMEPRNGPQTEAELAGLQFVATHEGENFYTEEELGGRAYFTAIYAERATHASCVACHNAHPKSPRRDLKQGEVMGSLVVRIPLEF